MFNFALISYISQLSCVFFVYGRAELNNENIYKLITISFHSVFFDWSAEENSECMDEVSAVHCIVIFHIKNDIHIPFQPLTFEFCSALYYTSLYNCSVLASD